MSSQRVTRSRGIKVATVPEPDVDHGIGIGKEEDTGTGTTTNTNGSNGEKLPPKRVRQVLKTKRIAGSIPSASDGTQGDTLPVVEIPKSRPMLQDPGNPIVQPQSSIAVIQMNPPPKPTTAQPVPDMEDLAKKPKWVPANWEKTLELIRTMRANRDAPVDSMGCERTMEENVEPKVRRYQALVSLMLSSQTKDEVNFAAMGRLKEHGLTVQSILDMDEATLGKMLIPVGFWKKKASYVKRATEILRSQYNDDIPETIEGLCALPGVGPKMGYIALSVAWGKHSGIGVDTHVHRISNRLGWAGPKGTKTPEQTRNALESWLPSELWPDFNILLVGFGQTICTPTNPKCPTCLANELCPFAPKQKPGKVKSKR